MEHRHTKVADAVLPFRRRRVSHALLHVLVQLSNSLSRVGEKKDGRLLSRTTILIVLSNAEKKVIQPP